MLPNNSHRPQLQDQARVQISSQMAELTELPSGCKTFISTHFFTTTCVLASADKLLLLSDSDNSHKGSSGMFTYDDFNILFNANIYHIKNNTIQCFN